jgi:hypothetical protein
MHPQRQGPEESEVSIALIETLVQPQHRRLIIWVQWSQQPGLSVGRHHGDARVVLVAGIAFVRGHVPLSRSRINRAWQPIRVRLEPFSAPGSARTSHSLAARDFWIKAARLIGYLRKIVGPVGRSRR